MKNINYLIEKGYIIYTESIRNESNCSICVVKKKNYKFVAFESKENYNFSQIENEIVCDGFVLKVFSLNWENYLILCQKFPNLKPAKCDKSASFGTGDRLGLVTAAHLNALSKYPVFPMIAQQSPRELEKEKRTFKSVLSDAVLGVLETGYTGPFGADADHIKDKIRLLEGIEAGYSMYTIDVSDELTKNTDTYKLNSISTKIVETYKNKEFAGYLISAKEITFSAKVFEKAMDKAVDYYKTIKSSINDFDFEISIDEGSKVTTPEDHLFCSAYLAENNIDVFSLAPKFPGKFQKALDYVGDLKEFEKSLAVHVAIRDEFGKYKLSLHSGSDKFSVYPIFKSLTDSNYHIKTSGTSYLRAVLMAALINVPLFEKMYDIAINNLDYNKKFYDVDIKTEDFPKSLNNVNLEDFVKRPDVTQLLHISYGSILDSIKDELYEFLSENENSHYSLVENHIEKHLNL